jgi:biotin transport system substrate-specific component
MNMGSFVASAKCQISHGFGLSGLGQSLCGSVFIALCSQISVPLIPIPITMQTLSVFLVASALGAKVGVWAVLLFLAEGALGAPVFANFSSGISVLLGPSGGYLLGFIPAVYIVGILLPSQCDPKWPRAFVIGILGEIVIMTCGFFHLSGFVGWTNAYAFGVAPFIFIDFLKLLAFTTIVAHRR